MEVFVHIRVKILRPNEETIIMVKGISDVVDAGTGQIVNLECIGIVHAGDEFMVSGNLNEHCNGYWYINIL